MHTVCVRLSMILHSGFSYFMQMSIDTLAKTVKEAARFRKEAAKRGKHK